MSIAGHDVIALVNKLRASGLHLNIDLPTVVLCGQQSCGKSSLSEAISGVPLPRAHGTCTRCPTEVRLIHVNNNTKWESKVFVRWEWNDIEQCPVHDVSEEHVGTVYSPREVSTLVTKAQEQILAASKVKFSRNVVVVEVRSENSVDLTVVDLPGLIQAVEDKSDNKYIRMTHMLVEHYIRRPNTIIAAVISCKDDMENQLINTLIRRYDKSGNRTIGILTKVDTIENGCEKDWIDILCSRRFPLRLGYIAIRNPSQSELGHLQSVEDARMLEAEFFNNHPVWQQLSSKWRERLGSNNLIHLMSETLSTCIVARLPKIRLDILTRMAEIRAQIEDLPQAPTVDGSCDIKAAIVELILHFTDTVKTLVRKQEGELWQKIMFEYRNFFQTLQDYTPQFDINEQTKVMKGKDRAFTIRDVKQESTAAMGRKLPFTTGDNTSRSYFIQNSIKSWDMCARQLVSAVSNILSQVISNATLKHFLQFKGLHHDISKSCKELIESLHEQTLREVVTLYERERDEFTMCHGRLQHIFTFSQEQFSKSFSGAVSKKRRDELEDAINIMAETRAYYEIAFHRFADVIPMAINSQLINKFVHQIEGAIFKSINVLNGSNSELYTLLEEDKTVSTKRHELQNELKKLSNVSEELRMLIPPKLRASHSQSTQQMCDGNGNNATVTMNGANSNPSNNSRNDSSHDLMGMGSFMENDENVDPNSVNIMMPTDDKRGKKGFFSSSKGLKNQNVIGANGMKTRKKKKWRLF